MYKQLTEEKLGEILDTAIAEFAEHGMSGTGMSTIAAKSDISVGVLYKYYKDKEDLFSACLKKSLKVLEDLVGEMTQKEDKPLNYARHLINAVQQYSRENSDYVKMYHKITTSTEQEAALLATQIEGMTSRIYTQIIAHAQKAGDVRRDLDPAFFAMFFDNLMMMMQFTYCCPYYKERYRLYRGADPAQEEKEAADQLLMFLESAFTLEQSEIVHRT